MRTALRSIRRFCRRQRCTTVRVGGWSPVRDDTRKRARGRSLFAGVSPNTRNALLNAHRPHTTHRTGKPTPFSEYTDVYYDCRDYGFLSVFPHIQCFFFLFLFYGRRRLFITIRPAVTVVDDVMRPAAAFGKPFTYLAAAPTPTASTSTANDIRPPLQQQLQSPVPASILHTFGSSSTGGSGGVPPTPPVRTSTATTGKQRPPPVPPRGEQTRLTTVPAKRPESSALVASPSPPPPPKTPSPPLLPVAEPTEDNQPPPPPPPLLRVHARPSSPPPVAAEPEEDLSASALISKFENGCAVKSAAPVTIGAAADHIKPVVVEVDSGTSTLAESTDDDENGGVCGEEDDDDDGAADIWVRAIESPVKNPQKVRHYSDSALKATTATVLSWPSVEKRGSLPADAVVPVVDNNSGNNKKSSPPPANKESTRSSFRSATGSRCSSPGILAQNNDGRRITAAEALGVVAKPCPRILPSSASLDVACRRQSLSNLTTDSRFSTLLSSSVRSSWAPPSGVQTDVESTQSEPSFDYRRKKFTKRCSSADGRNPVHHHHHHHHYHTMSGTRVTAARDPDFGAKRAFIQEKLQAASAKMRVVGMVAPTGLPPTPPPSIAYQHNNSGGAGDCSRPPRSSSCNCGQHQATSRPMFVNKRTVSAEELLPPPPPSVTGTAAADSDPFAAVGRPVSSSSSSSAGGGSSGRGSFGRPQRVTFALDQHQQLYATASRPASSASTAAEQGSSSSSSSSSIAKKPFKSNLKVKDAGVPELNVLGTSAINTRLPPQHPHPYGLPYKLPAVTADVLQVV